MKKEKVLKDNEPQLVLAYIEKSSLFTQNHNLLIFEKEHCTICSNITGKWQKKYTYTTTYDQIRSNPINNSFTIGPYSYKGKANFTINYRKFKISLEWIIKKIII